ncbi:hypothetical protein D9M70_502430 [compost metagenome]
MVLMLQRDLDGGAQGGDGLAMLAARDLQALASDEGGIDITAVRRQVRPFPAAGQLRRVQGLGRDVQAILQRGDARALQPGGAEDAYGAAAPPQLFQLGQVVQPGIAITLLQGDAGRQYQAGDQRVGAGDIQCVGRYVGEEASGRDELVDFVEHQGAHDIQGQLAGPPPATLAGGLTQAGGLQASRGIAQMALDQLERAFDIGRDPAQ